MDKKDLNDKQKKQTNIFDTKANKVEEMAKKIDGQIDFFNSLTTDSENNKSAQNTPVLPKHKSKTKENIIKEPNKNGLAILTRQSLDEVLHNSMIPYSECVLLDRALPRVEDGLKPVQRRILYTMYQMGLTPDKTFKKSATIVGDCMGKLHPHGDSSVYDALVRMAQPFNMGAILVHGHGNFGSIDGDSAAAMRYTEAKLTPLSLELLRDIEKESVNWSLNFDDSIKEPDNLPSKYPNLLVNGAMGIAVGLATNIPPHNLGEVIDGTIAVIDNPNISLKELMKIIKGPDFPTGGIIATEELVKAYETGKGRILIRAKTSFETLSGKTNIIIHEIPYQKNKANTLAKIAEIRDDKKGLLLGITEIRDESDRKGMRGVITVKQGYDAEKILQLLFKYSELQTSYGINMVAIADGKPKQLGLIEILKYYIAYQVKVLVKSTEFDLNNALERVHILQGLKIAIQNIDEVIAIIKASNSTADAKVRLITRFNLSERQSQAILDMRLARLTNLEVFKIETEIKELNELINKLTAILKSKTLQYESIKKDLIDIKTQHSVERKSKLVKAFDEINVEELMASQKGPVTDAVIALTRAGTLKRFDLKTFETSVKQYYPEIADNEIHFNILKTKSDKTLLCFTNKGNVCKVNVEDLKEAKWRDKGTQFRAICKELDIDEKIIVIYEINDQDKDILFVTKYGMLKRSALKDYNIAKMKFVGIKLKDDDEVINVVTYKNSTLLMITKFGISLNCDISELASQGRVSLGVKGITLNENDYVVFGNLISENDEIVILTKNGFGKKLKNGVFESSIRARKGVKCITLNEYDNVISALVVNSKTEMLVKLEEGYIKKATSDFFPDTRTGKGKNITRFKTGQRIFAIYKNEGEK